mmetsp:Transcript_35616/g.80389  ORF Transcript_35616/g.80389 Transcript_35616/m.80389 type:complete len:261 (+) Transcript_35616:455-1237(+)
MNWRAGWDFSMPFVKSVEPFINFSRHSSRRPNSATATGRAAAAVTFPANATVNTVSSTCSAVSASPSSVSRASRAKTSCAGPPPAALLLRLASCISSSMSAHASCLACRASPNGVSFPKDFSTGTVNNPAMIRSSMSLSLDKYCKDGSARAPSRDAAATSCVRRFVFGTKEVEPSFEVSSTISSSTLRHMISTWGTSLSNSAGARAGATFCLNLACKSPPLPPGNVSIELFPKSCCMDLEKSGRNCPARSNGCMCSSYKG